ncbi:MAG TPA: flagellar biosynthetic protein FliR [Ghiorsea sp.]|nr:flagellar biosynthetic protein FliR [Ghiorsea sp.]HIP06737.1 flagellar biosynthetic protein FliR [Mariprofundaceae bacterium]
MFPFPSEQDILVGTLIFLRISLLMMLLPVLGHKMIPAPVKAGFVGLLTLLLFPVVSKHVPAIEADVVRFALLAIQEMLLAAALGLLAQLIFTAAQFAGQVMSLQMGMAMASIFDPATSSQSAIVAQFVGVLAILMWLASGAHHMFIMTLIESFSILPPGSSWSFHGWQAITDAAAAMFVLAVKLMAPVLLLLFFVYVALGLIARAVPQVQVFFVSFPLSVGLGLLILGLSLPAFMSLMHDGFVGLGQDLPMFLKQLSGQ